MMGNCGEPRLVEIELNKGTRLMTSIRLRDAAA
jgi:hypothetical protein